MDTRSTPNIDEAQIKKKLADDMKRLILTDPFSERSSASQFMRAYVPPFSMWQREVDQADCTKSFLAGIEFNKNNPDNKIDLTQIPSCLRLRK